MNTELAEFPSRRFKYAFQVALALVIAYGLALAWDWERPRWVAFAVIAIALPHTGISRNRGIQRLLGTLFAAVVALVIIALFPQDRWLFVLAVSTWLGICTYMMGFSGQSYFWHCAGFVASIIAMTAANSQGDSFRIAIDRTLESGLGIIVYTAVSFLVWPNRDETAPPAAKVPELFFPDRDQVVAGLRVFIVYWLSFLVVVYVPAFPTGLNFLAPMGAFAMAVAATPQLPIKALYKPIILGLAIASFLYMFIMPRLEGFTQLGLLIFVVTLVFAYRYYSPADTLSRLLVLVIFSALTGINNDQAYTFAAISNNVLIFVGVLVLLIISTHLPESTQPEANFMRLLQRFRTSARQLSRCQEPGQWLLRWVEAYHWHELATIPQKLAAWQPRLSPTLVEPAEDELAELMASILELQANMLSSRIEGSHHVADSGVQLDALTDKYAMIDWAPWREPRF